MAVASRRPPSVARHLPGTAHAPRLRGRSNPRNGRGALLLRDLLGPRVWGGGRGGGTSHCSLGGVPGTFVGGRPSGAPRVGGIPHDRGTRLCFALSLAPPAPAPTPTDHRVHTAPRLRDQPPPAPPAPPPMAPHSGSNTLSPARAPSHRKPSGVRRRASHGVARTPGGSEGAPPARRASALRDHRPGGRTGAAARLRAGRAALRETVAFVDPRGAPPPPSLEGRV